MASNDLSKHFKGTHEVQECQEGEDTAQLDRYKNSCKKPHAGFVPVNKFTLEHLPSGYHDNDLYAFTKAMADLTVRVAVKFTSPDRPEFIPGTKDPYPFYNSRGQNSLRTGTGKVENVTKFTEEMGPYCRTCPCPECDHSATPSKVWWQIEVRTATHVVFDSSEARQSSCRLWFDEEKCPVVKIFGWKKNGNITERDWCQLHCVTHDPSVADKLKEMWSRFSDLCASVCDKYKSRRDVDKLTIIVSHPHGCCKQVSVGHWVHREQMDSVGARYTYTTCTCPGSSGAIVHILGRWPDHPHSGANPEGLNYSGVTMDIDL